MIQKINLKGLKQVEGGNPAIIAGVISCAIWWCMEPEPIPARTGKALTRMHWN